MSGRPKNPQDPARERRGSSGSVTFTRITANPRDLAGLRAFLLSTPRCRTAILGHNGRNSGRLGDRWWELPLSLGLS